MFYVYAIKSQKDGRLYKGLTSDINRRIHEHNSRKTFSTKPYIPWELVYSKEFDNRISAREYELFLKSGKGRDFLKHILHK